MPLQGRTEAIAGGPLSRTGRLMLVILANWVGCLKESVMTGPCMSCFAMMGGLGGRRRWFD